MLDPHWVLSVLYMSSPLEDVPQTMHICISKYRHNVHPTFVTLLSPPRSFAPKLGLRDPRGQGNSGVEVVTIPPLPPFVTSTELLQDTADPMREKHARPSLGRVCLIIVPISGTHRTDNAHMHILYTNVCHRSPLQMYIESAKAITQSYKHTYSSLTLIRKFICDL